MKDAPKADYRHRPALGEPLSPREIQVIDLVIEGHRNASIAANLNISEETIRRHMSNIFDKTGSRSRIDVALTIAKQRWMIEFGINRKPPQSSPLHYQV